MYSSYSSVQLYAQFHRPLADWHEAASSCNIHKSTAQQPSSGYNVPSSRLKDNVQVYTQFVKPLADRQEAASLSTTVQVYRQRIYMESLAQRLYQMSSLNWISSNSFCLARSRPSTSLAVHSGATYGTSQAPIKRHYLCPLISGAIYWQLL